MNPDHILAESLSDVLDLDKNGKVTWVTAVRKILENNGFSYIWINTGHNLNHELFLKHLNYDYRANMLSCSTPLYTMMMLITEQQPSFGYVDVLKVNTKGKHIWNLSKTLNIEEQYQNSV